VRILIAHDYGRPVGGAERMSQGLRDGLRERGHESLFFGSTAAPIANQPMIADETCYGSTKYQPVLQAFNPAAARRFRQVVAEFRPDVVHVRMFLTQLSPLILKTLRDVPAILHVVNYNLICPINTKTLPDGSPCHHRPGTVCHRTGCMSWLGVARWAAQDWLTDVSVFDRIITNSHWTADRLRAEDVRVDGVVHNGVAVTDARPPLADDAVPTVAYAGRLIPKKGVDVLLRAVAKQADDVRLLIAGDGPQRGELEQLAAMLGLAERVTFLGHVTADEMQRAFATAWVQAAPSTWEEPFGLVAAEGMMRGTAVVTTDSGGLAEQVEVGVTGFTTPAGDVEALATALRAILTDREKAEAMGRAGRERALELFTMDAVLDRFEAIYAELVR
jgi:glycosyltransferase involved in cell wall biosynthesis